MSQNDYLKRLREESAKPKKVEVKTTEDVKEPTPTEEPTPTKKKKK